MHDQVLKNMCVKQQHLTYMTKYWKTCKYMKYQYARVYMKLTAVKSANNDCFIGDRPIHLNDVRSY